MRVNDNANVKLINYKSLSKMIEEDKIILSVKETLLILRAWHP